MNDLDKTKKLWLEFEDAVMKLSEADLRIFREHYPHVCIETQPSLIPPKLPEVDTSGNTYELFKGGRGSDPIASLGQVWGNWLEFFTPELGRNYISIGQLRHRDEKLLRALTNKFQQATKPIMYNNEEVSHLEQLIYPKLSEHPSAIASRNYYQRKKIKIVSSLS